MSWRPRSSSGFEAFRSELERLWRPEAGSSLRSGAEVVVVRSAASTNAIARRAFERDRRRARTRVVIAWEQTRGKGRRGRAWLSPAGGGLYASILVPVADRVALESLPLLVPVELCRSLAALGVGGCGLKWPNDLVVDEGKLGGILVEAISPGGAPAAAVVGIGVNYRRPDPAELDRPGVGLCDLLEPLPSLATVTHRLVGPLVERLAGPRGTGAESPIEAYRDLSVHRLGERLACRTAAELVEGDFVGFDDRGFLRLMGAAGERKITTGEIVEY